MSGGRIFDRFEEGIQGRRRRISESSRVKIIGAGRKNNGGVHSRI